MLVTTRVVRSIFHRGLQLNYGRRRRRRLVYQPVVAKSRIKNRIAAISVSASRISGGRY